MAKEELKQEAERYIIGQRQHYTMDFDEVHRLVVGFAEDKIADLEKQIEKMKRCENCKHYNGGYLKCICKEPSYSCNRIFNGGTKDLWELAE